jgi:hypothetical protein
MDAKIIQNSEPVKPNIMTRTLEFEIPGKSIQEFLTGW